MLPGIAGGILMCVMPFMPESPRFVMEREGYTAGVKELNKVRSGDVTAEANSMQEEIKKAEKVEQVSYKDLVFGDPNLRKRLFIACTLVLGQQATGVNAFPGYAATIFKMCGIEDALSFNVLFNFVMFFGCLAGLLLVDSKFGGRKCQLLAATMLMGPPLVLAGFALMYILPREAEQAITTTSTAMPEVALSSATMAMPVLPMGMPMLPQDDLLKLAHITTMICVVIYGWFSVCLGYRPMDLPCRDFLHERKGEGCVHRCLSELCGQCGSGDSHTLLDDLEHPGYPLLLWGTEYHELCVCLVLREGNQGCAIR